MLLRYIFFYAIRHRQAPFDLKIAAAVLLCAALLLAAPGSGWAEEDPASGESVYSPAQTRLVLPENWRPTGVWAQNPSAEEQPEGLLFSGEAHAPTGEAVTLFTLHRLPPLEIPSEVFPLLTPEEEQQLCDALAKNFIATFTEQTGVAPAGSKTMLNYLNGWHTVMLTARFISNQTDIIANRIIYSLPEQAVALTFLTETPMIAVVAPDITYILDNFQPDTRIAPRDLPARNPGETLDAYLVRMKNASP
jgi:hypothetical protein